MAGAFNKHLYQVRRRMLWSGLNETGGHATSGTIQVFIPRIAGYTLDFDETQTVATNPNVVVGNSTDGWTSFTYPNGALLLTTNNSIPVSE
ncbi:MAG: hypothetical protein IPF68_15390 [Bacteroidales bacterium]|nr:hypothetical protein [Bacteroidales bacterium]